jgi:hypothetical protein
MRGRASAGRGVSGISAKAAHVMISAIRRERIDGLDRQRDNAG